MAAAKEEGLQPKPATALVDLVSKGITESVHMTAAVVRRTETAGTTATVLTPGDLRAETTATRCRVHQCFHDGKSEPLIAHALLDLIRLPSFVGQFPARALPSRARARCHRLVGDAWRASFPC